MKRIITALTCCLIPMTVLAQSASELNNQALELIRDEKYEAALKVFDTLVKDYPNDFIGWYNKASAHALIDQKRDALSAIEKAVQLNPDSAEAWYLYGQTLSSGESAIACFEKAINARSYIPGQFYLSLAWFNKGLALYEHYKDDKKRYDEVIECINNGLGGRFNTTDVVLTTKAFLLFEMGRDTEAITAAESAIASDTTIDPFTHGGLYNVIGLCDYKLGEPQKALEAYAEAIDLLEKATNPLAKALLAGVWNNEGVSYHIARQYEDAIRCYDKALSIADPSGDSNSGYTLSNKGYTLFVRAKEEERQGRSIEARKYYQQAFEAPLGSPEGLRREDLDELYTDDIISLVRLGDQGLRGIFFIRNVEEEGMNFPTFDVMRLYTTSVPVTYWREKIEDSKLPLLPLPMEPTKSSGPSRPLTSEEIDPIVKEYLEGKSWALVIGVDGYNQARNGIEDIPFTQKDAELMSHFFNKEAEFDYVISLTGKEATKQNIEEALKKLKPGKKDRVVIYFSGHGYRYKSEERKRNFFYLIPIDGEISKDGVPQNCVSMSVLNNQVDEMNAKHVLVILDCCYSGGIGFKGWDRTDIDDLEKVIVGLSQNPGRHALTAGTDKQKSLPAENRQISLFTMHLLEGLKGGGDGSHKKDDTPNKKDGLITLAELLFYVQDSVMIASGGRQTPQLIPLTFSDMGQFVYITPEKRQQYREKYHLTPTKRR